MAAMAKDDSIEIIEHFCYKCRKSIEILTAEQKCLECGTGFVEVMPANPHPNSKKSKSEKSPRKNECSICLQSMDSHIENIRLKCQHSFHKQCVKRWFETGTGTCPLCRADVDIPLDIDDSLSSRSSRRPSAYSNANGGRSYGLDEPLMDRAYRALELFRRDWRRFQALRRAETSRQRD